jgi:Domain of unknown function (DUF4129)
MTGRQLFARLLPVALLVVLVIVGLRGAVASPRWDGSLRASGVAIGLALEVVLGVLLVITLRREAAARRAAEQRVYAEAAGDPEADDIGVPTALRYVLKWVLITSMVAVAAVLISNLHLHFFTKLRPLPIRLRPVVSRTPRPTPSGSTAVPFHIPLGPILYALLVLALAAAVAISIWWSARQRRPALPGRITGEVDTEELLDVVESGRAALAELDDARAAIIACYLAMERSLADRGAVRGAADTPDELLAGAVAAGVVRGTAARRLTALFYEARFSSHPLGPGQRDAAKSALDELAAELHRGAEART